MSPLRFTNLFAFSLAIVFVLCLVPAADAGVLATHASAFNNGSGPDSGAWRGSTSFSDGSDLTGSVDWAVFTSSAFPFSGYSPTAGELVYTYQVNGTGTDAISSVSVALLNAAANAGTFTLTGGEAADGSGTITGPPGTSKWIFTNLGGIGQGESSVGLAFSSPNVPTSLFGSVVDGGSSASVSPLASPSNVPVPEPTALALAGLGALVVLARRRLV